MNILKHAVQACRSASRSPLFVSRIRPAFETAIDRSLHTAARVLCVESHGVMTAGPSSASVAHLTNHRNTQ
ncbi:hypothetical protein ACIPL1_27925 [Pseudomonas sp. NPDC090202]|uniref:hypothetical protein n=1 Tax=unclassified Pseudomonas TaxID=196821 RepID=UPI0037F99D9A